MITSTDQQQWTIIGEMPENEANGEIKQFKKLPELRTYCINHFIGYTLKAYPDISYVKNGWAFEHSNPFKGSPDSHSQLARCSVGTTSSCSLLAFPLLVSIVLACLCCLCCSSVSWTHICARLLLVATPILQADVKSTKVKSHSNNVRDVIIAHVITGLHRPTNGCGKCN